MSEALEDLDALLESHLLNGRYALDELIGRGGMASVYRGIDLVLGRTVAIKVLDDTAHDPTYPARLRAEARTLAALDHPHLVSLLDASVVDGRTFLVLELVEGGTLRDVIAPAPLDPVKAAVLGHQLSDALAHVHAAGVVHRDLKPSNVLIAPSGPKLADFGVALLTRDAAHQTESGIMLGTAAYISPEQVQGRPATAASDIYSLGLVLLEALTGERAYPGTAVESAMARLHREPHIPATLPQGWQNVLRAMTALTPQDRPDARSVARHLARLSDPDRALRTALAASTAPAAEPAAAPRRRSVAAATAVRSWLTPRRAWAPLAAVPLVALALVFGPDAGGVPADAEYPDTATPRQVERDVTLTAVTASVPSSEPAGASTATATEQANTGRGSAAPAGKPAHAGGPGGNPDAPGQSRAKGNGRR